MKRIILIIFLATTIQAQSWLLTMGSNPSRTITYADTARTYYVDATSGSDANDGLSTDNAWKTISKVNSSSFNPADQVLFKRGEVWTERMLQVSCSGTALYPIVYSHYGTGAKPLFLNADTLEGWSQVNYTFDFNRIEKSDFEVGLTGWDLGQGTSTSSISLDSTTPLEGNNSLTLEVTGAGSASYQPYLNSANHIAYPFIAGNTYQIGFKYRVNSGICKLASMPNVSGERQNQTIIGSGVYVDTVTATVSNNLAFWWDGRNLFSLTIDSVFVEEFETANLQVWKTTDPQTAWGASQVVFNDSTFGTKVADTTSFNNINQFYATNGDAGLWVCTDAVPDTSVIHTAAYYGNNLYVDSLVQYVTIDGLDFKYGGGAYHLVMQNANNIIVKNCRFEGGSGSGIQIERGSSNITIANDTLYQNQGDGIYIVNTYPNQTTTVYDCYFYDNGKGYEGDRQEFGFWNAYGTTNFHDNYIYHNQYSNVFELTGENGNYYDNEINVYNNMIVVDTCDLGVQLFANNINFYFNTLIFNSTNQLSAFYTGEGNNEVHANIYNNTIINAYNFVKFYENSTYPVSGNSEINFKNNILYGLTKYTDESVTSGIDSMLAYTTFDYNLINDTTGVIFEGVGDVNYTFATWQSTVGQDANSVVGNPTFTTEFTDLSLQTGSPAINAGTDVGLTRDILGNPIVGLPDIGAYEKQ